MQHRFRFLVRQAVAGARETPGDPVEGWERVREKRAALHLRAARSRALRYAAAIVLVAATVIYLHLYRRAGAPVAGEGVDVPSRVTLILANGEQIRWEDDRQQFHVDELGISIARDSAGSVMRYSAGRVAGDAARHNRLIVPRGCEFSAQLPDGSTVWLNSATTLRFPVAFPPGERVVHLEGEAYFEVAPDARAPFRVISGDKVVTVLGTRFNISAYGDDPTWHVTLVDGAVSVRLDEGASEESILQPAQQLLVREETREVEVHVVETETYTAWTRGQIYFKLSPLEEIVKKLERWYDFEITYEDEALKRARFRGGINKYRPLEETLRYLEETGKVRFSVQGKNVIVTRAIEKR